MKKQLNLLYDVVLPNGPMPNALLTEFGLVKYLNSLHTTDPHHQTLEQEHGISDTTLLGAIYERSFGSQSNSLNGSNFLSANSWSEKFTIIENSLHSGRTQNIKYIYPIRMSPDIDSFTGVGRHGKKNVGEYFWKHMSNLALTDVQERRALILLDFAQENSIAKHTFDNFHNSLAGSNIPKEQIILIMNSFNAKEVYESWYGEDERRLTVVNFPFVTVNSSHYFEINFLDRVQHQEFINSKDKIRDFHYIFKIRRPRNHRLAALLKMQSEDMLDKADWSCLQNITVDENLINYLSHEYNLNLNIDKCKNLILPHNLSNEKHLSYSTVSAWTDKDCSAHLNSYLYVCTETYVDVPYKFFTEKVFKPIANFQPFMHISYPGALKMLKELGFKTFHPFINEDYDNESDTAARLNLILKELKRISDFSKSEIHEWYWSMQEILEYNQKHLLTIWRNNQMIENVLEYLFNKTA